MIEHESPTFQEDCGKLLADLVRYMERQDSGLSVRVKGMVLGISGTRYDVIVERTKHADASDG